MRTLTLWSEDANDKLLKLAREAIRCALGAADPVNGATSSARAQEALAEYHELLKAVMTPPIVIDMLRTLTAAAVSGDHIKIVLSEAT